MWFSIRTSRRTSTKLSENPSLLRPDEAQSECLLTFPVLHRTIGQYLCPVKQLEVDLPICQVQYAMAAA
jgi:hypothetical protein